MKEIKKAIKKHKGFTGLFIITVLVVVGLISVIIQTGSEKKEKKLISTSILIDTIDIAELSTAQFTYNGIAQVYEDEDKEKIKCNIRYSAKVKAGIDMDKVKFEIDETNHTVKPILPEIKITASTIDEKNISFIPSNVKIELKEALVTCEEDAQKEATESTALLNASKENVQSIIQALLYPIIEEPYKLIW